LAGEGAGANLVRHHARPPGAEHRARLIETVLAPLLVGRFFATPQSA
jgi:hypothetical protein